MYFNIEGNLYNESEQTLINGTGSLKHIYAGEYACILNLDFEISPELLNIDWPGEEKVRVQILQTILKREGE